MAFEKYIHYDGDIEMAILGIALLEPNVTAKLVAMDMKPEYFYYKSNQKLMQALIEMHEQRMDIDLLTAHSYLVNKGLVLFGPHNTGYFLAEVTKRVVKSTHLMMHCQIIKNQYNQRQLVILATKAATGASIDQLKRQAGKVIPTKRKFTVKEARYLLKHVDKQLIKETADKFGSKTISGRSKHRMKVVNEFLVYFMHLVEPYYTWTTMSGDEDFGPERVRQSIVKGAKIFKGPDGTYWGDPIHKYPYNL